VTSQKNATRLAHYLPANQPSNIRRIVDRLFPSYRLDGGHLHLAGCSLEFFPVIRFGCWKNGKREEVYLDRHGRNIQPDLIEALEVHATVPLSKPPETMEEVVADLRSQALAMLELDKHSRGELDEAVIWAVFARGKIELSFRDSSDRESPHQLDFSDWAVRLHAPPFRSPYSGHLTYHVAMTDSGAIAAADEIGICESTGQRVLKSELVQCSATGKQVLQAMTSPCAVSGKPVLRSKLVMCPQCHQWVSPRRMRWKKCEACQRLERADVSSEPIAHLLQRYPRLSDWQRWYLSETYDSFLCLATRGLQRVFLVLDRESFEVKHALTGSRFGQRMGQYRLSTDPLE
jgi:hypothetical protein